MKLMPCPMNGPRNISEFVFGGEVTEMPEPENCSEREWADYVFMQNNTRGIVYEWWMHVPTSSWFIAERNTETDEIIKTFPASELFNQRVDFNEKQQ